MSFDFFCATRRYSLISALTVILGLGFITAAMAADKTFQIDGEIVPFKKDGIHDPGHDAIDVYQHPKDALAKFPRSQVGEINWVKALDDGLLIARSNKLGDTDTKAKDLDVIMTKTGVMPFVKFPHRPHTELLTCGNCHPALFPEKANATEIDMKIINSGQSCGVCHGKVSFPPTKDCMRCHSVSKK